MASPRTDTATLVVSPTRARELAGGVDVAKLGRAMAGALRADEIFGAHARDPAFAAALETCVVQDLGSVVDVLRGEVQAADTRAPQASLRFAERVADGGIPAAALARSYRAGSNLLWREWFAWSKAAALRDGVPLTELLDVPQLLMFESVERLVEGVLAQHERARLALARRPASVGMPTTEQTVRRLLDGALDDEGTELERALGYALDQHHLFLLVDSSAGTRPLARLGGAIDACGCTSSLAVRHGDADWAVWLGRRDPFTRAQLSATRRTLAARPSLAVTVGGTGHGLEGFRRTRLRALETFQVRETLGVERSGSVWASDLRLETMLLRNRQAARDFVLEELGLLADPGARFDQLRETLLAWLDRGSYVSAGATLGVHENTVRGRIREVEGLLDRELATRRAELHVALRLIRVLPELAPRRVD